MLRQMGFELGKIWGQKRFLSGCLLLLTLNLFLLWYTNLPDETTADLSAYKTIQSELASMTEEEKGAYMKERKETMDGVGFVQEILMLRGISGEMGEAFVSQEMAGRPGVFEAYYELYQSGAYLRYTDSLWQEANLVEELYEEWEKCADYEGYLKSVQEAAGTLQNIGIFGGGARDSFSARNVQKSARDYLGLSAGEIRWMPGKPVTGAMENAWTDLFVLLSVFFFAGSLILEEKEKGLLYITRSTRWGLGRSIAAKLTALFIHCIAMAGLLYGVNVAFYGMAVGYLDLGAALQSVAAFRESCLQVSVLEYMLLTVFTKGLVLFGFGALLTAICIRAERGFTPYGAGFVLWGAGFLLYQAIPAASGWNWLKYLNLMGMLKTEQYYGGYLNFDLFGHPVSRMLMTWILLLIVAAAGTACSVGFYIKGESLALKEKKSLGILMKNAFPLFKPHDSLLRHEGYKLLIANRAVVVLAVFGFLAGYYEWGHSYFLSAQETYYQNLMLQLEGGLTEEKEQLLMREQARYQEAFDRVSQIDRMVSDEEISESTGENLKMEWNAVTCLYPSFVRAWEQYERIRQEGGDFIYDTGYLYLFGALGESLLVGFSLLCCGVVLSFSGAAAMEEAVSAWKLLASTRKGKCRVLLYKGWICGGMAALLSLVPFVCRLLRVGSAYPLGGLGFSAGSLPYLRSLFADALVCRVGNAVLSLPVWGFLLLLALSQAGVLAGVGLAVLGLSCIRRDFPGTCFLAALLFLVPLALVLLGFPAAEPFSLYPLYSWAAPR